MFSRKRLRVEIFLSKNGKLWTSSEVDTYLMFNNGNLNGISGTSTPDTYTRLVFDDFKIDATIKKVFSAVGPTATIKIYGVSKQHLNMMTIIGAKTFSIANHKIRVSADCGNGYITVFEGCITEAVPVYQAAPECYIQIESSMAAFDNAKEVPPTPLSGDKVAISEICKNVCAQYGVSCVTSNELDNIFVYKPLPTLPQAGLAARLSYLSEGYDLSFILTPSGYRVFKKGSGSRVVWTFTPDKYIGYPSWGNKSIQLRTENFSNIAVYDLFRIKNSEVTYANGLWYITMIEYKLQSRLPNGRWEATLYGIPTAE